MLEFIYTNGKNRTKKITIHLDTTDENGKIFSAIWDIRTGDLCSSGYNTKEELEEFLACYGIETKIGVDKQSPLVV